MFSKTLLSAILLISSQNLVFAATDDSPILEEHIIKVKTIQFGGTNYTVVEGQCEERVLTDLIGSKIQELRELGVKIENVEFDQKVIDQKLVEICNSEIKTAANRLKEELDALEKEYRVKQSLNLSINLQSGGYEISDYSGKYTAEKKWRQAGGIESKFQASYRTIETENDANFEELNASGSLYKAFGKEEQYMSFLDLSHGKNDSLGIDRYGGAAVGGGLTLFSDSGKAYKTECDSVNLYHSKYSIGYLTTDKDFTNGTEFDDDYISHHLKLRSRPFSSWSQDGVLQLVCFKARAIRNYNIDDSDRSSRLMSLETSIPISARGTLNISYQDTKDKSAQAAGLPSRQKSTVVGIVFKW